MTTCKAKEIIRNIKKTFNSISFYNILSVFNLTVKLSYYELIEFIIIFITGLHIIVIKKLR